MLEEADGKVSDGGHTFESETMCKTASVVDVENCDGMI
jgi:hypothetical protein